MKSFKMLALISAFTSVAAFAECPAVPEAALIKKATTTYKSMTGNYRLELTVGDLNSVTCTESITGNLVYKNAASVKITDASKNQQVVQSYTTDLSADKEGKFILVARPQGFIDGGFVINFNEKHNTLELGNAVLKVDIAR